MRVLPLVLFCLLVLLLGFSLLEKQEAPPSSAFMGKSFPALELPHLNSADWQGKAHIVNLFASWCLPCAIEHPLLMRLAKDRSIPIVGIAWKDKPKAVEDWLAMRGSPYAVVIMDETGKSTIPLALTGVPETFIVDKKGVVRYHTKLPFTETVLNTEIIPLLERLRDE